MVWILAIYCIFVMICCKIREIEEEEEEQEEKNKKEEKELRCFGDFDLQRFGLQIIFFENIVCFKLFLY